MLLAGVSPSASLKRDKLLQRNAILRRTGFIEEGGPSLLPGARPRSAGPPPAAFMPWCMCRVRRRVRRWMSIQNQEDACMGSGWMPHAPLVHPSERSRGCAQAGRLLATVSAGAPRAPARMPWGTPVAWGSHAARRRARRGAGPHPRGPAAGAGGRGAVARHGRRQPGPHRRAPRGEQPVAGAGRRRVPARLGSRRAD